MSKFTRGNWELNSQTGSISSKGILIAKVAGATVYNAEENAEESFANARLIAAAPKMYELLKVWTQIQAQPTRRIAQQKAIEILASIDDKEKNHEQHTALQ